ncbi:carbohydrate-binding protein [Hymenobacter sp.]|uniref:carbohydrate-binding protein n=1 Tax=Hymenobacter sp. TaxID=1898978 RepID=UPI00286A8929|nr:carbohydrate-binding protein [Hymenobacter sp.]
MKNPSRSKTVLGLLLLLLLATPAFAQFKVIGYLPSWTGNVGDVQYDKLTHINYAFLLPNADGSLRPIENPAKLQSLVATAHARGVKVLVSVGGWMNDGNPTEFASIGNNANYTRTFATNLINFASQYGLDGIDIDWEHPTPSTANGYAAVMQELATRLHGQGKLLTTAVAGGTWAGGSIQDNVLNNLDFLNIMAYDDAAPAHSTYALASQSMGYWRGRGLPASKTVLGVPFYGQSGGETFASLVSRGADPNADFFNGIGYNGIATIKSKTNLAFDQGSGVMIWQLAGDAAGANSLLTAIRQVVVARGGGGTPPPPGAQAIPGTIQAESFAAQQGTLTEPTTDAGGGVNVDYFETNDWLDYNVTVATAGAYTVGFRVASANGGATLQLRNGAGTPLGSVNVGNTGGWQSWQTINVAVNLPAGTQTLRLFAAASTGCNVNYLSFATASGGGGAFSRQLEAEAANTNSGMVAEGCTDAGGGQNMGYIDAADYLVFTNVNFPTSGTYLIEYRVASGGGGGTISSDLNANAFSLGSTAVPGTGGWQNWVTVSKTVNVAANTYNFGVYASTGGYNLNWVRITKTSNRTALASPAAPSQPVVSVYPNPVLDRLTLDLPAELLGKQLSILSMEGRQVWRGTYGGQPVDVSALRPGLYTLVGQLPGGQKIASRFSKQ